MNPDPQNQTPARTYRKGPTVHQTKCGVKHKPLRGLAEFESALDRFMDSRGMLSPSELAELKAQARIGKSLKSFAKSLKE